MVATEVGPKKDELKAVKKAAEDAAAAAKAELEAHLAELKKTQDELAALNAEVTPFRAEARTSSIKKAIGEARKEGDKEINPLVDLAKFEDIMLLAKIADTDAVEDVVKKVSDFVATRPEYAFKPVEPTPEVPAQPVIPANPIVVNHITREAEKPAEQVVIPSRMVTRN